MLKLGVDYFASAVEAPYRPGVGWTWNVLGPNGSLLCYTKFSPAPVDRPFVTLEPPEEVNKGTRKECWVSGCRVHTGLKKCEVLNV